jgi:ABC-type transport system involved in multi-copper enzyme maturation permease subunit
MGDALMSRIPDFLSLSWLGGPIFGKELRVSSRRKRHYFLRCGYLGVLTIFVVFVWLATVNIAQFGSGGAASLKISRMSQAGQQIVASVVWFQFISTQLVAIVLLSTAINDEIYRRTLGLLMTTPISSLQIVMGKLFSKLLQLVLLLAISLPLLAIVRVFGGVPWYYVISSLCITLTAAVFAGSLSLFLSIHRRKAHQVIFEALCICFILYCIVPAVLKLLSFVLGSSGIADSVLLYISPFMVMALNSVSALSSLGSPVVFWPMHCAVMIGASSLFLAWSVRGVRRAALRQATGQPGLFASRRERRAARTARTAPASARSAGAATVGAVRAVKGSPLIWKDMQRPQSGTRRAKNTVTLVLFVVVLSTIYCCFAYYNSFGSKIVQIGFVVTYLFLGLFSTSSTAASSVTSEKEANTWPILLTTPLDDRQIAWAKIVGSIRQYWVIWALLAGHLLFFTVVGSIHPLAALLLVPLVVASALLVSAVGVCFSCCCRRSSAASALNMICFLGFAVPFCCSLPVSAFSPLSLAGGVLALVGEDWPATSSSDPIQYPLLHFADQGPLILMLVFIVIVLLYLFVAYAAFSIAQRNVRRKIF